MKQISSFLVGIAILLMGIFIRVSSSSALTIDSPRNCDDNAVIRCGALNFTELENRSDQAGAPEIFSSFGISMQDIANMRNVAVEGVVTNNNNVWIHRDSGQCPNIDQSALSDRNRQAIQNNPNLCLVGTDAMTAGRQDIAGSTMTTSGGITFFKRPPSVSFVSSSLPAFVVMDSNHQFLFAIIASCGNPVNATPTPVVTATKTTTTNTVQRPTQTQTQTVVVNTTPAVQSATTTQTTQPATTKALPNTGPGNILALSGATTMIGTLGHFVYSRRNRRF